MKYIIIMIMLTLSPLGYSAQKQFTQSSQIFFGTFSQDGTVKIAVSNNTITQFSVSQHGCSYENNHVNAKINLIGANLAVFSWGYHNDQSQIINGEIAAPWSIYQSALSLPKLVVANQHCSISQQKSIVLQTTG